MNVGENLKPLRELSYKYMEELEDPFVAENVQDVARHWIDDGESVDLVFEQGIDGIKEAKGNGNKEELSDS